MSRPPIDPGVDDGGVIDDVRMVRTTLRALLRRLADPPVEGRIYVLADPAEDLEGDSAEIGDGRGRLNGEIWIVNASAAAFVLRGAACFADPAGRRFVATRLETADWRRISAFWVGAGGVATAENVLAAALAWEKTGEIPEPGDDAHATIHRQLFARR